MKNIRNLPLACGVACVSAIAPSTSGAFTVQCLYPGLPLVYSSPTALLTSPQVLCFPGLSGAGNHEAITQDAFTPPPPLTLLSLSFTLSTGQKISFTPEAIKQIVKMNWLSDSTFWTTQAHHFDFESFTDAQQLLVDRRKVIDADSLYAASLAASTPILLGSDGSDARAELGIALHAVQDFYAHSTWIEQGNVNNIAPLGEFDPPSSNVPAIIPGQASNHAFKACGPTSPIVPTSLSSGYYSLIPPYPDLITGVVSDEYDLPDPSSPLGYWAKCDHGRATSCNLSGSTLCSQSLLSGGINKDSLVRVNFPAAYALAVTATQKYIQNVVDDLENKNQDQGHPPSDLAVCILLGINPAVMCGAAISPASSTIAVGGMQTLQIIDSNGNPVNLSTIQWSVDAVGLVSISATDPTTGAVTVTGDSPGSVKINAVETTSGTTLSASVTVGSGQIAATAGNIPAQSLLINTAMTPISPFASVSGGGPPYTYHISSGTLPAGLSLNATTGVVGGTPTTATPATNVTFSVADANGVVASTTSTVSFTVITVCSGTLSVPVVCTDGPYILTINRTSTALTIVADEPTGTSFNPTETCTYNANLNSWSCTTPDYIDFAIDKSGDGVLTPNVDVLIGTCVGGTLPPNPSPGQSVTLPMVLGSATFLGNNTWTGCSAISGAAYGETFGSSTYSVSNHDIFNISVPLSVVASGDGSVHLTAGLSPPFFVIAP